MTVYDGLNLSIIVFGILMTKFKLYIGKKKVDGDLWFLVLTASMLIFLSAFRGDFTGDYNNYANGFNSLGGLTLKNAFTAEAYARTEKGYIIFTYLIKHIFNNQLYIFIISSVLTVLCNVWHIRKYADDCFLAIMLFVVTGIYYISFTLVRQCMAVSIIILGSKYLYERKTFKYLLIVFFACIFHRSAIIMLPFYFVSTIKINKKLFLFYLLLFFIMVRALPEAINIARMYSWDWYTISARGVTNWKSIVLQTMLSIFAFVNYIVNRNVSSSQDNTTEMSDRKNIIDDGKGVLPIDINNIWLNGTFLYLYFKVCGLFLDIADRFSLYFSIYAICFYIHQISKSKYGKIFSFLSFIVLIIYEICITHTPYYFIWES